jgi:Flp pilus assembly pilin Flp
MNTLLLKLKAIKTTSGQDLTEYALIAGFLALTVAAILPGAASGISAIFSEVGSVMPVDSAQVTSATN